MLIRLQESVQFDLSRCVQCGTCLAACKHNALAVSLRADGLWEILPDAEKCVRCFHCVAACPAHSLPQQSIAQTDLDHLRHLYLAHAVDPVERANSSSGGAARVLAQSSLECGLIDSVHAVIKKEHYPWAEGAVLTHPLDSSQLANSMYLPILVNKNLHQVSNKGPILLIGTTCQLLAADRILKNSTARIFKIAIFCKQQKSFKSTCFMARRLGVPSGSRSIESVKYRGIDWPGHVTINGKHMEWETAAALPYGKRLWRVPGCLFCAQPFGVGVDLTLADPWGIDPPGSPGNTLVAVWTEQGEALLKSCQEQLHIKEIDKPLLHRSVTWKDIERKRLLVNYYSGKKVSRRIRIAGLAERIQTSALESILERFPLPELAYKFLSHLPDATDLVLKQQEPK